MASSDVFGLEAFELLLIAKLVGLLKRAELARVMVEGLADIIKLYFLTIVKVRWVY